MDNQDIRWQERFSNYLKALSELREAVDLYNTRELTKLEKQGLIQAFEFTHEVAWNVIKDYFKEQGNTSITGSKDAAREAFKNGIVKNGHVWMDMVNSRNQTSHTYSKDIAEQIVVKIKEQYIFAFNELEVTMKEKLAK